MSIDTASPKTRMNAEDRRELVLGAAMEAFGRTGYAGTSTDAIAKEAGVSQPYVVRIFGTKLDLFIEVFDRACVQVMEAFEGALDGKPFDVENDADWERLGSSYTELVLGNRAVLQVMMHGFAAGSEPRIGETGRARMGEIFDVIRRTGCTNERAREFIAEGMLINVMLGMDAPAHAHEADSLAQLSLCAFGLDLEKLTD